MYAKTSINIYFGNYNTAFICNLNLKTDCNVLCTYINPIFVLYQYSYLPF